MREILFRGYDKIAQCWCYGYVLRDADIKDRWYIMNNYSDGVTVERESVGQWIGLQDKTGMRIFEGDMVLLPEPIEFNSDTVLFEVKYLEGQACFHPFEKLLADSDGCEVVSNIYENTQ